MEPPTYSHPKALVIYDEEESGNVWGYSLKQIGLDVIYAHASTDIIHIWAEELPDLIVLEGFNPEFDEVELCRKLRHESPVPILLLTYRTEEAYHLETYRAGIDECIVQPISPRMFIAKVRAWMRRAHIIPTSTIEILEKEGFRLDASRRLFTLPDGSSHRLTNLEARLLYVLMNHQGEVIDPGILIEKVWGRYSGGDNVLLKNIVYRLRRKIEPDPAHPSFLLTEGSNGYILNIMKSGTLPN